jgi:sugar phosphate isomerase/epimerase
MIYEILPIEKALERLQYFGVKYSEYSIEHFEKIRDFDKLDDKIRELRELVPSFSLRIVQMHAPYGDLNTMLGSSHEGERRKGIDLLRRWLGYANQLNVEILVMHPFIAEQVFQSDSVSAAKESAESNITVFKELSKFANDSGVKIAIENRLETVFGCRIPDLLSIVNVNLDNLGICLDTGHAMVNGISPAIAAEQARDALIATHLNDNDSYGDQHLPPLMGNIDWSDFMRVMESIQYGGLLMVEIIGSSSSLRACDNRLLLTKGAIDNGLIGKAQAFSPKKPI